MQQKQIHKHCFSPQGQLNATWLQVMQCQCQGPACHEPRQPCPALQVCSVSCASLQGWQASRLLWLHPLISTLECPVGTHSSNGETAICWCQSSGQLSSQQVVSMDGDVAAGVMRHAAEVATVLDGCCFPAPACILIRLNPLRNFISFFNSHQCHRI